MSATERITSLADQLLSRYGVLPRDAIAAESTPGGFTGMYPVLRAMEEAGRVRRGYFVEGLGGSQFAQPAALDRLRALRDQERDDGAMATLGQCMVLAAVDPANPYGTALPWPKRSDARVLARAAGALVILVGGSLAGYITRGDRSIVTFLPEHEPDRSAFAEGMARALFDWSVARHRYQPGWQLIDDVPLLESSFWPYLRAAGFVRSGPGIRVNPAARTEALSQHA